VARKKIKKSGQEINNQKRESLRNKQQKKGKSGQEKNLTTKPEKRKV